MSWIGAGIGAFLGSRGGLLGSIIGAVVGNWVEEKFRSSGRSPTASQGRGGLSNGEFVTLAAISAMMSKMAKADGHISVDEVRYCEGVFDRLGLRGEKREYCIRIFQTAKSDRHSIFEYADSFAESQGDRGVREVVYDILWDVACADGTVSQAELDVLRALPAHLHIAGAQFAWQCRRRGIGGRTFASARSNEADPYEILGVNAHASDEEVRKAYREKAKALHPDRLRAEGLSDELLGQANAQMAKVNEAWAQIKHARHL